MKKYKKYFDLIKKIFIETHENAGGSEFRYFHSINVANISNYLANKNKLSTIDKEIVIVASLFHDISKHKRVTTDGFLDGSKIYEISNKLKPHELESAEMASNFIKNDFLEEIVSKIKNTIVNHSNPSTIYEKVLHDADELSEMGVMNLWKMFTYSSYKKRNIADTVKYWNEEDKIRHMDKVNSLFLNESKKEGLKRIKEVDKIINNLSRAYTIDFGN